jgi:hypothetical protein
MKNEVNANLQNLAKLIKLDPYNISKLDQIYEQTKTLVMASPDPPNQTKLLNLYKQLQQNKFNVKKQARNDQTILSNLLKNKQFDTAARWIAANPTITLPVRFSDSLQKWNRAADKIRNRIFAAGRTAAEGTLEKTSHHLRVAQADIRNIPSTFPFRTAELQAELAEASSLPDAPVDQFNHLITRGLTFMGSRSDLAIEWFLAATEVINEVPGLRFLEDSLDQYLELYGQLLITQSPSSAQIAGSLTRISKALWQATPSLAKQEFHDCQMSLHSISNKKYNREKAKIHDSLTLWGLWEGAIEGNELDPLLEKSHTHAKKFPDNQFFSNRIQLQASFIPR